MTEAGVGEVVDCMPISHETDATEQHDLLRIVRVVRGEMTFVFDCRPRFDYGRAEHTVELTDDGAVFASGEHRLTLHTGRLMAERPFGRRTSRTAA